MTIAEYISSLLMIISFVVSAFMALIALKVNKKNKQQRRAYLVIIALGILLAIVLSIFTAGSINKRQVEKYNSFMTQAEMEFKKGNYLSAADLYNQAASVAYSDPSKLEAQYWKGASYFAHGGVNNSDNYLHSALREYRQLIAQYDETISELYIDAVVDSSCIYYFLEYPYTDENWVQMISWLENRYNIQTLEGMEKWNISLCSKITMSIAYYYDAATMQTFIPGSSTEYMEKAVSAYKATAELWGYQNQDEGLNPYDSVEQLHFLQKFCDNMLSLTVYNIRNGLEVDYVTSISEIIDICKRALETVGTDEVSYNYIQLNTIIGKGNWLLGGLSREPEKTAYYGKAYETLMPPVRMQLDPEYRDALQTNAGYFAIVTLCCEDDDVEDILELYRKAITQYTPSTHLNDRIEVLTSACSMCEFYLENYPENIQIDSFAREIVDELDGLWGNQLTDFEKQCIEAIREKLG